VKQAREAAGGKDVSVAGGASVIQQALAAELIDEFQLHIAPVLLGAGVRLFAGARPAARGRADRGGRLATRYPPQVPRDEVLVERQLAPDGPRPLVPRFDRH
jgi:dihydrofolate reductase